MKLPAVISRLFQKAAVTPLGFGQGWFTVVRESFAGAFQANIVVDAPRDVLSFSPVYSSITGIADDIAKLRSMLVEKQENGTCVEVMGVSPFKQVLERPNHYQNRIQFLKQWFVCKLIWGNTYVLKERDARGVVVKQYILDPQRVKPLVTDDGGVYYELAADNLSGLGENVTVPAKEIIHDRICPLWHPLVGIPPLYASALSATMGNRIQKNSTSFFQNMSRPGGLLVAPGKLDDEDAARIKAQWEENYGGQNSGRTAVLGNGLKYESTGVPAEQAQLVEQLKWTIEDVARAFKMPAFKLGGPLPANTSVEEMNQTYYSTCLQIHIEDYELCMKDGLALPVGYAVKLDLEGLFRMDAAALVTTEAEAVKAGIKSPNEARLRLNLPPVTGGETPYLQQQNYNLGALAKRDALADPFGKEAPKVEPPKETPKETPKPANDEYAAARELADLFVKGLAA